MIRSQLFRITVETNVVSSRQETHLDLIFEPHRLHDGPEIMVTVWTAVQNAQYRIDFGGSGDCDNILWRGIRGWKTFSHGLLL